MSIRSKLFPPANREAAGVAFIRTFWQVVRATGFLGGAGIITVTATDLVHVNVQLLLYALGGVLISGILSGSISAGDILVHGLPAAYTPDAPASDPEPAATVVTPPKPLH